MQLAERKRFTYKSAYLYEQIQKKHELQEEYLVVAKYDVKSFADLVHLKFRLQRVDEELCKVQEDVVAADMLTEPFVEAITEAVAADEITAEVEAIVENATVDVTAEPAIEGVEDAMVAEVDIVEKERVATAPEQDKVHKFGETMKLPSDKTEYMRMDVAEKVRCYPFDDKGTDAAFEMVQAYFEKKVH